MGDLQCSKQAFSGNLSSQQVYCNCCNQTSCTVLITYTYLGIRSRFFFSQRRVTCTGIVRLLSLAKLKKAFSYCIHRGCHKLADLFAMKDHFLTIITSISIVLSTILFIPADNQSQGKKSVMKKDNKYCKCIERNLTPGFSPTEFNVYCSQVTGKLFSFVKYYSVTAL